ncbi:hypothetical protein [Vibrio maerlii]|uniref:hypothetical protein n=1 Tax=Vibrio maerlii TaxID=2231648 RepID=UPI000E3CAEF1|nr:hypothetical protein [Vibrio maerlii]
MKKLITLTAIAASMSFAAIVNAAPVEFQKIPEIMAKFEDAELFRKKTPTLGRLPAEAELGKAFPTYVSDGKGGYSLETENTMTNDVVIASMPKPIVGEIYNQWLVPQDVWVNTYGELPTSTEFKPFKRIKTIKAIKIDEDMLELMGSENGKSAIIKVSWDENGMKVYKDGYLADYEYGIAPQEMKENYELAK